MNASSSCTPMAVVGFFESLFAINFLGGAGSEGVQNPELN